MSLMIAIKKLLVPLTNATKQIDVAQTWEVRWTSVSFWLDSRLSDKIPEMEAFFSQEEAIAFAESLEAAVKLLRFRGCGTVTVRKRA